MTERICQRCGACAPPAAAVCPACGIHLPPSPIEAITVGGSEPARRPDRAASPRLSQIVTLPDQAQHTVTTGSVRHRQLAPPVAGGGSDYELQTVLGEGGMGVVWSARQAGLLREVAVKRVRPGSGPRAAEQLIAEAELTGSLEHPGIVPVYEVGIDQDQVPFYAMRRLRGRTWSEQWYGMNLRAHLDVLMRVCDAIAYAHGQGVIHRDIKPANVFLGEYGEVVVFDWGLAARLAELRNSDRRLLASGTPAYMAPEMASAERSRLGPASDVYLLGAVLYEILTGLPPHPGEDNVELLFAAANNRIEPPIPAGELGEVARRAMATMPESRQADVRAFQAALRTCLDHQESVALASRAQVRLAEAGSAPGYDAYARAVHAFEDAIDLWPQNHAATAGLSVARLTFAQRARQSGDLDLAADLLSTADPAHGSELLRIGLQRVQQQRRRRAFGILQWTSAALLVILIAALIIGLLAVSHQRDRILTITQERDAAEAALTREQIVDTDGRQRMWRRVVQEDFSYAALPAQSRVLAGRWGITASKLVAEGDEQAVLVVPLELTRALVVQVDLGRGGSMSLLLGGEHDDLSEGEAGTGLTISLGGQLVVRHGAVVLTTAPLAETVTGLARRLRVELDQEQVRVLVDGRTVAEVPLAGLQPRQVGLAAEPGAVLDNLKIEVPWE